MQESSIDNEEGSIQTKIEMVVLTSPFSLTALYYCQELMHSMLYKELSKWAYGTKAKVVTFNGVSLFTKCRFYLCHLKQIKSEARSKTRTGMLTKEHKKLFTLINSNFIYPPLDDKEAKSKAFNHGEALYIIGSGNQPAAHQIIAVVLYVMSPEGTYINWLDVTSNSFSTILYDKNASDNPFRGMGLGRFFYRWYNCKLHL